MSTKKGESSESSTKKQPLEPGVIYVKRLPSGKLAFVRAPKKKRKKNPKLQPTPAPAPEPETKPEPPKEAVEPAEPQIPPKMADATYWYYQAGPPPGPPVNHQGNQVNVVQPNTSTSAPPVTMWNPIPLYPPVSGCDGYAPPSHQALPTATLPPVPQQPAIFASYPHPAIPISTPVYYSTPVPVQLSAPSPAPTPAPTPAPALSRPGTPGPPLPPKSPLPSAKAPLQKQDPRHRCMVCGRYRSPAYHYQHPILPGEQPLLSVCRKCKQYSTSSNEGSDDSGEEKRKRCIRRSRKRSPSESSDQSSGQVDHGSCCCSFCRTCLSCGNRCCPRHRVHHILIHGCGTQITTRPYSTYETDDSFAYCSPLPHEARRGTLYRDLADEHNHRNACYSNHRLSSPSRQKGRAHGRAIGSEERSKSPCDSFMDDQGAAPFRQHHRKGSKSGPKERHFRSNAEWVPEGDRWQDPINRSRDSSQVSYLRQRPSSPGQARGRFDLWNRTSADYNPGQQGAFW
ncbi:hypothetical protein VTO42DRAFT_6571 [Malbranchea cinnamomea]